MRRRHKSIHPGAVLEADFMKPLKVSVYRLARNTGISARQIGRILVGARRIDGDAALRLARCFGTSAQVWLNLQARHDHDCVEDERGRSIERRVPPFKAP